MAMKKVTKVRMLKTTRGSPDGIKVNTYNVGTVYIMPTDLARVFVKEMKVASVVKESVKGQEKKIKRVKNRETRIEKNKKENRIDP